MGVCKCQSLFSWPKPPSPKPSQTPLFSGWAHERALYRSAQLLGTNLWEWVKEGRRKQKSKITRDELLHSAELTRFQNVESVEWCRALLATWLVRDGVVNRFSGGGSDGGSGGGCWDFVWVCEFLGVHASKILMCRKLRTEHGVRARIGIPTSLRSF